MTTLAPSIATLQRLRSLDISSTADVDGGVAALAPHLSKLHALRSLNMAGGICMDDAENARALSPLLSTMTMLHHLDIGFIELGDDGAAALAPALAMLTQLTSLAISGIGISMVGATTLLPSLRALNALRIGMNCISDDEYAALNDMLPSLIM